MKDMKLRLSMRVKDHVICVGKDVTHVLGNPDYVCLLSNEAEESIALQVCDRKHVMSYKVPEGPRAFRICSLSYTEELAAKYNLKRDVRYHLEGEYREENKAVVFPLKKWTQL